MVIKSVKDGKASGPKNLSADVLKLIEEQHLGAKTSLFNKIYETGMKPKERLQQTSVTILVMFLKIYPLVDVD
ncbi:hypothetical protein M0802_015720 [Mischocyttarus mexicanus]|nr:hypothetical protein M0802_015720 [Mischocyttarus mexicanus]